MFGLEDLFDASTEDDGAEVVSCAGAPAFSACRRGTGPSSGSSAGSSDSSTGTSRAAITSHDSFEYEAGSNKDD